MGIIGNPYYGTGKRYDTETSMYHFPYCTYLSCCCMPVAEAMLNSPAGIMPMVIAPVSGVKRDFLFAKRAMLSSFDLEQLYIRQPGDSSSMNRRSRVVEEP